MASDGGSEHLVRRRRERGERGLAEEHHLHEARPAVRFEVGAHGLQGDARGLGERVAVDAGADGGEGDAVGAEVAADGERVRVAARLFAE
jgi:hypothetical protein